MQNSIAGAMAVLGVVLVLAGAGAIILKAMRPDEAAETAGPADSAGTGMADATVVIRPRPSASSPSRLLGVAARFPAADRLIAWGTLLLILAAVAAGAISFHFGVDANSTK